MRDTVSRLLPLRSFVVVLGLLAGVCSVGCQSDIGGQTLPSPNYLQHDVQYAAPGPEFKLQREASALRERASEEALRNR
ncbi:MAG: hypothetical protein HQ581_17850 [Planctomycetes bacterium]|nr:hypothetical protein [Planctomycetota bacterium]